jgi:hypothetical protein
MAYVKDQQVYGWSHSDTKGQFVSVCAIPEGKENALYVCVRRPINGQFYYVTERMASRLMGANEAAGIPANPELAWAVDSGARYPLTEPETTLYAETTYPTGQLVDAEIIAAGSGYTDASVVVISDPNPEASGAEITITTTGGAITGVTIVEPGQGYTAPTFRISGGSGGVIGVSVQSLQDFSTDDAIDASEGDVLRVGGGMGIVTDVASSTAFTCNMTVPIKIYIPNTTDLPPTLADSGEWSLTTPVTVIGGLDHLTGQYASGLADGSLIEPQIVVDGCITLPQSATAIVAGLGYSCQLRTLKLGAGSPAMQGRRKSITSATLRTYNSRGLSIGHTFEDMVEIKDRTEENYGEPIAFQTGGGNNEPAYDNAPVGYIPLGYADRRTNIGSDWEEDGYICLQQSYPLPTTILDIVLEVQVGDDPG